MIRDMVWNEVRLATAPYRLVDVTATFEALTNETFEKQAKAVSEGHERPWLTKAHMRTAWVFVGQCNMLLPRHLRVHVSDHEHAVDNLGYCFTALMTYAGHYRCVIHNEKWTIWAGRYDVIKEML